LLESVFNQFHAALDAWMQNRSSPFPTEIVELASNIFVLYAPVSRDSFWAEPFFPDTADGMRAMITSGRKSLAHYPFKELKDLIDRLALVPANVEISETILDDIGTSLASLGTYTINTGRIPTDEEAGKYTPLIIESGVGTAFARLLESRPEAASDQFNYICHFLGFSPEYQALSGPSPVFLRKQSEQFFNSGGLQSMLNFGMSNYRVLESKVTSVPEQLEEFRLRVHQLCEKIEARRKIVGDRALGKDPEAKQLLNERRLQHVEMVRKIDEVKDLLRSSKAFLMRFAHFINFTLTSMPVSIIYTQAFKQQQSEVYNSQLFKVSRFVALLDTLSKTLPRSETENSDDDDENSEDEDDLEAAENDQDEENEEHDSFADDDEDPFDGGYDDFEDGEEDPFGDSEEQEEAQNAGTRRTRGGQAVQQKKKKNTTTKPTPKAKTAKQAKKVAKKNKNVAAKKKQLKKKQSKKKPASKKAAVAGGKKKKPAAKKNNKKKKPLSKKGKK
jgi:hypothetical protein